MSAPDKRELLDIVREYVSPHAMVAIRRRFEALAEVRSLGGGEADTRGNGLADTPAVPLTADVEPTPTLTLKLYYEGGQWVAGLGDDTGHGVGDTVLDAIAEWREVVIETTTDLCSERDLSPSMEDRRRRLVDLGSVTCLVPFSPYVDAAGGPTPDPRGPSHAPAEANPHEDLTALRSELDACRREILRLRLVAAIATPVGSPADVMALFDERTRAGLSDTGDTP